MSPYFVPIEPNRRDWFGIFLFSGFALFMAALVALAIWVSFVADPIKHTYYKCEDRGGIKQAVATKRGYVRSVVCEDGTIHQYERRVK